MKATGPALPLILCNPPPLYAVRGAAFAFSQSGRNVDPFHSGASAASDAVAVDGAQTKARLTIRTDAVVDSDRGAAPFRGQWLLGLLWVRPRPAPEPALGVRIVDLQGKQVFGIDDAGSLVRVLLVPGTYHITMQRGALSRCYTMTLEQGTAVELHAPIRAIRGAS